MEQQYHVVLSGQLKAGWTIEKAAKALANLMRCDVSKATNIIQKAPTKLKKIMPRSSAEKYKQRLEQTGIICSIEPSAQSSGLSLEETSSPAAPTPAAIAASVVPPASGGLSLEPTSSLTGLSLEPIGNEAETTAVEQPVPEQPEQVIATLEHTAPNRVICPKCKLEQDKSEECSACGIIFNKFLQAQQAVASAAATQVAMVAATGDGAPTPVENQEATDIVEDAEEDNSVDFNSEEVRKLLKNTYGLLAMTLLFSAITAAFGMNHNPENISVFIILLGAFGLYGVTYATRNSGFGIVAIFAFTGWMGYWIGPTLNYYLMFSNGGALITTAAAMTAAVFLGLSGYVLISKKDFSFMGSLLFAGLLVLVCGSIAALFFNIPGFVLALSVMGVLIFSGYILYDTSQIIHGGETNYIMATVSLYLDVINMFLHLLRLLSALAGED